MTGASSPKAEDDERARQAFMERYKADRALELELSKFSGGLERSFLQAGAVLNGGSVTVFLSFLGSTTDKTKADPYLISMSFTAWLAGLALVIATGWTAYQAQSGFLRAARNRRHVSGLEVLGESYRSAMAVKQGETPASLNDHADSLQREAERHWDQAVRFGIGSVILFAVGAVLALITVLTATAVRHAP